MPKFYVLILIVTLPLSSSRAQSPYGISWPKEGYIFGSGIAVGLMGVILTKNVSPLTVEEINRLSRDDVNAFDRPATYNYSINAKSFSDVAVVLSTALPAILLFSENVRKDFKTFGVMYVQTLLFVGALPTFGKGRVVRTRPFVYNPDAPLEKKLEKDARFSWYSGHTTSAFAGAVFFSTLYGNYFPHSRWKPFVWGGSLLLSSLVGYLRVEAGKHFPTDVLTGAAVGSAIGFIIPWLHRQRGNTEFSLYSINAGGYSALSFNFTVHLNKN